MHDWLLTVYTTLCELDPGVESQGQQKAKLFGFIFFTYVSTDQGSDLLNEENNCCFTDGIKNFSNSIHSDAHETVWVKYGMMIA